MVLWKHELNLKALFDLYKNEEIDLNEFSNKMADMIERSHYFSDYGFELENIVEEFRGVTNNDDNDYLDLILESLYDWGDGLEPSTITTSGRKTTKTCWIET